VGAAGFLIRNVTAESNKGRDGVRAEDYSNRQFLRSLVMVYNTLRTASFHSLNVSWTSLSVRMCLKTPMKT